MPIANGEPGIRIDLSVQQARRFAEQTPDGRISARERRQLQDPAELSAQGQRLALQSEALGAVRESLAGGDALLDTAESGFERIDQLLNELRDLSVSAARDDVSSRDRATLNEKFQEKLAELDRIANQTSFNGQNLLDAEVARLAPLGTTQFQSVATVDGGTGTFELSPGLAGQGLRDIRFRDVTLTSGTTVTNNGFTFPDIREFTFAAIATPLSNPRLNLNGVPIKTADGTTTENFALGGGGTALTATTTGAGGIQITATTLTTVTADGVVKTGAARFDLSEDFAITLPGPVPATTTTLALAGEPDTTFDFQAGTGTVPAEDEITASIGGVTPGALALRDVSLRGDREANRAVRLVDEAGNRLKLAEAGVRGDGQRLSEADDNARTQKDGTDDARDNIRGQRDTESVSKQVADNIVNQTDLGIGLLGNRQPKTVFERLF